MRNRKSKTINMTTPMKRTQTTVGNEEQSLKQALEHAESKKARGNSLFKEGKHDKAADEYNNALDELQKLCFTSAPSVSDQGSPRPEVLALMVALRSNLAACHQATGQHQQAATESQAALALDPLHTKAYFRLCKAMYSLERFEEAAKAMAVTVALTLPGSLDSAMQDLYIKLMVLSMGLQFKLPPDISSIACVASDSELRSALSQDKSHVVLKPGSFTNSLGHVTVDGFLALIGVGKVEIRSGDIGHAIHVKSGEVYVCHLNLVGNTRKSVVCVGSANARLNLVDCVVQDQKNVGVLIVKGHAILERCSFTNIDKHAVEVCTRGSAELKKCRIMKCYKGVIAYGGTRQLKIFNCEIKDIAREGVLVCGGKYLSAGQPAPREWGEVLDLQISSTVVTGCGCYGVSVDMGVRALIVHSVLVNNSPFAISVKGATTSIIAGCHIETGDNCGGLHVTANYNAAVKARDNTFVIPVWRKFAIVQAGSTFLPMYMQDSWSKPVICHNNQIFVGRKGTLVSRDGKGFPSPRALTLEELEMREGPGLGGPMHSQNACPRSDQNLTLTRTSRHLGHDLQKATPFYPVGNTFGYDLSLGQDLSSKTSNERHPLTIRILLGACGDIRNLVKTVSALQPRLHPRSMVQVVLNDNNVVILARDILLLSLIAQRTSATDVVAIWANHALTSSQRKLLDDAFKTLSGSLPKWLVLPAEPGCNLEAELLDVFASWRDCTMTLQQLLDVHEQILTFFTSLSEKESEYMRETLGRDEHFDADEALKVVRDTLGGCDFHCFDTEIKQSINSGNVGNVTKDMQSPNPTLLDAPSLQYQAHWLTSIYRAIKTNVAILSPDCELYEILLMAITPQIKAVADSFARGSLRVAVDGSDIVESLLGGGFLRLLRQLDGGQPGLPSSSPILFDFIDVSNVSDYVSMPAVVQAAVPLLKTVKHATIHAQSLMWCGVFPSHEPSAFLRCAAGMDLESYQELLGVRVHTQVVGVTDIPPLQTQWTWDLSTATQQTWLTGAMVLLEVMSAAKLYCGIDRASYVSNGWQGGRVTMSGPSWAGIENASPLTMLHLLHLCCPRIVLPIMRVLVVTNDEYRKREWELMSHAMFQRDVNASKEFVKLVFHADADFFQSTPTDQMPLCLTVSTATLTRGEVVASARVLQVLETISYFAESDRVEVMLQRALAENPKSNCYFMTLCVVEDCTNLRAVGTSVPWSKLSIEPLTQGLPRWAACEGTKRSLLSDDLELLELMEKQQSSGTDSSVQSWKTHAVLETARYVVVELLLPRPFPGPDEVVITVTSSGTSMRVAAKAVPGKKKGSRYNKRLGFRESHVVKFPTAVCSDGHSIKVSRKLCLMIVRLPKLA